MNPVKSIPIASIKTIASLKSDKSCKSSDNISTIEKLDFAEYLMDTCKKYECPIPVAVEKDYQLDPFHKSIKNGKSKIKHLSVNAPIQATKTSDSNEDIDLIDSISKDTLAITAIYDYSNHFTEILISKYHCQAIPRIIIQLIGLVISHYEQLTRLTIKRCRIDIYTLHELSKLLPFSTITDICLDECPLPDGNYDIILNNSSRLQNLSLCRCEINDAVCEKIASRLCYSEPAEEHLFTLNLSSNNITNVGAKHLALALRSNRHLLYLNLADNLLSDEGATHIFDVLREFTLTHEETMEKRHRYMLYLKKKHAIYIQCLEKCYLKAVSEKSHSIGDPIIHKKAVKVKSKTSIKRRRSHSRSFSCENIPLKANMMATELVGPFTDPFCSSRGRIKDGYPNSDGNLTLCYLNVAYNDLTYASVNRLLSVLEYQHNIIGNTSFNGLLKVVLDGNLIPLCAELDTISNMLYKRILSKHSRKPGVEKKSTAY